MRVRQFSASQQFQDGGFVVHKDCPQNDSDAHTELLQAHFKSFPGASGLYFYQLLSGLLFYLSVAVVGT